ncbi:hypothetical protein Q0F98_32370 [Paenibacillus amylolyticus]|nr:hypothetical protein Q0F98_32370 [Paenibacillus amylolyticus]
MRRHVNGLCLFILLLLVGCTTPESESVPPPISSNNLETLPSVEEWMESAVARDTSTKPIVLGFSQLGRESAWRLANSTSIRNAAAESGISLVIKMQNSLRRNSSRLFGRSSGKGGCHCHCTGRGIGLGWYSSGGQGCRYTRDYRRPVS